MNSRNGRSGRVAADEILGPAGEILAAATGRGGAVDAERAADTDLLQGTIQDAVGVADGQGAECQ